MRQATLTWTETILNPYYCLLYAALNWLSIWLIFLPPLNNWLINLIFSLNQPPLLSNVVTNSRWDMWEQQVYCCTAFAYVLYWRYLKPGSSFNPHACAPHWTWLENVYSLMFLSAARWLCAPGGFTVVFIHHWLFFFFWNLSFSLQCFWFICTSSYSAFKYSKVTKIWE